VSRPPLRNEVRVDERAAPEPDPAVRDADDHSADLREDADAVVVGSGPCGMTAALELAQRGLRVVVVEAGRKLEPADFEPDVGRTLARHFWDGGMRVTRGNVFLPTMQARCVGGGSVFNSAICMRALPSALRRWADVYGVEGCGEEDLRPHFEAVESFMGVRPVQDAVQGTRNLLFLEAARALGWEAGPLSRNELGCVGSGDCILGCRAGAKLSSDRRGLPEFLALGGRLVASARVDEVLKSGRRARGVAGVLCDRAGRPTAHRFRVTAPLTVLSAGTIATPILMRRSGLRHPGVGDNLQFHPSTYLVGVFDRVVHPWAGATQGAHATHFLDRGIKLESLWADPAVFSIRFPADPVLFQRYAAKWPHLAVWDGWTSGADSVGTVRTIGPRLDLNWQLGRKDVRDLVETNALLAEMFRAAGAVEVLPGMRGLPPSLDAATAPERIRAARVVATDLPTASNHVFGATAMGIEGRGAVDSAGAPFGWDGLFVADTGLFPDSPGVNPMLTGMALARRVARIAADRVAAPVR
jgi:choline dehydrogenase-like flavoprotein